MSDGPSERLKVFADESFDGKRERVAAVAGLIGTESEWSVLEAAWIERIGGKEFHATTCETEYANDPDPDKHRENLRLYEDLTKIIANSRIRGYGSSFDLISYRENFPNDNIENGFLHGVADILKYFSRLALTENRQVEFFFDNRQGKEYIIDLVYQSLRNIPILKGKDIFYGNRINFDNRSNTRIQAADLTAREAMKFLDNYIGPVRRPHRASLKTLANQRIQFFAYEGPYFKDFREKLPEMAKRYGVNMPEYDRWLSEHKLTDNQSNRLHYMRWLDITDPIKTDSVAETEIEKSSL
jgi:hypothetical protein